MQTNVELDDALVAEAFRLATAENVRVSFLLRHPTRVLYQEQTRSRLCLL
ncbi:MAG: type II toxin-antitoxin system VapB family antitoxin [Leptolyngbyaceae cyanobacterium]